MKVQLSWLLSYILIVNFAPSVAEELESEMKTIDAASSRAGTCRRDKWD